MLITSPERANVRLMSISVEPLVLSLSGFISTVHYDIVSQMKFKGKQSYKI